MKLLGRIFGRRTMLSCHQVGKIVQTYLDGELDDASAQLVASHLDDCRRCGLDADTFRALRDALRHGPALADEPVARLRAFGERLSRGELDTDEMSVP